MNKKFKTLFLGAVIFSYGIVKASQECYDEPHAVYTYYFLPFIKQTALSLLASGTVWWLMNKVQLFDNKKQEQDIDSNLQERRIGCLEAENRVQTRLLARLISVAEGDSHKEEQVKDLFKRCEGQGLFLANAAERDRKVLVSILGYQQKNT